MPHSSRPHRPRLLYLLVTILFLGMFSGCATMQTYEERSSTAYSAYAWGATENAAASFAAAAQSAGRGEKLLWELETAKAYQAAGDFNSSLQWFEKAENSLSEFESEADIVARDAGREMAALITNPNTLAYKGLFTDRIFLNTYQALNYLALHQLEGAAVESRRAMIRQQEATQTYASEIARLQSRGAWSEDENAQTLYREFYNINASITPAASRFANPMASWLRAIIHHMRGDLEQTRFELKALLDDGLSSPNLRAYHEAVIGMLEHSDQRERWCFVVFENGRGPTLEEERLELIVPKLGLTALSLPKPRLRTLPFSQVKLQAGSKQTMLDTLITANALFSAEFKALFPTILARTLASYATKEVASRAIVNQAEGETEKEIAYIATGLYKYLTARSDTRVWQTRGNAFMVAAFPIKDATPVTLQAIRSDGGPTQPVTITPQLGKFHFAYIQGLVPGELITVQQSFD